MEEVEVGQLLARRGEHDRLAGHLGDRQRGATPGVAVELGEDHAVVADAVEERLGGGDGVLADHRVDDEEHLVGLDGVPDVGGLLHHLGVDAEAAGGVDDDDVVQLAPRLLDGVTSHGHRVADQAAEIRVIGNTALPTGNRQSTKQTEYTYGLMMHMSKSLGVNCTYCHNSRSFAEWDTSTPQRATAWYGIRMARDLNTTYLDPLAGVYPANRLGPTGDVPKLNCATCHQGAFKPMYGASMLATHPELAGVRAALAAPAAPAPAAPTASAADAAASGPAR